MKRYDGIIFDLDGTLWDASRASATGWNVALRTAGVAAQPKVSRDDIRRVSGKPFAECVTTLFPNLSPADGPRLTKCLDEHERLYVEAEGGDAYPAVIDGMEALARDYRIFLVSNCQHWYLEAFWKHIPIERFFQDWDCHGASGNPKSEMLKSIVQRNGLGRAMYIGDTMADKHASDAAGVDFGFVSYGFGAADEPTVSFESFEALVAWFRDNTA